MFSFLKTIFSAITSATISLVASLGLISAPAQLPANIKTESAPIVQQQSIDEPKLESEQSESDEPIATDIEQPQSSIIPMPVLIKTQTSPSKPAPTITPTPVPVPTPVQTLPPTIYVNTPMPSVSPTPTQIEITYVKVTPSLKSANFEWGTIIPTNAKVFVLGSDIPTIVSQSNSGISTHHVANVSSLQANKSYDFKIEAVSNDMLVKIYTSSFKTTSLASMKIFSPGGNGLGPRLDPITGIDMGYRANNYPEGGIMPNDSNSISIGLLVRNDEGVAVLKYDVTIEAIDPPDPSCWSCRRFMKGTGTDQAGIGSVTKIYKEDGTQEIVSYYPFRYEFKTAGQHTIKFTANGMSESITLDVK